MDVQITKPSQMDMVSAARTFIDLTSDRGDKGPALSDQTAMSTILAVADVSKEKRAIKEEQMERAAYASGILQQFVLQKLGLAMAAGTPPNPSAARVAAADPALAAAAGQMNASGETAQQGGTSPALLQKTMQAHKTDGPTPNQAQPEQRVGYEARAG